MNDKQLQTIFRKIKDERRGGAPAASWVKSNREILMMQVKNTVDAPKLTLADTARNIYDIFFPSHAFALATRAIAIFVLALGSMLGGGIASVQAYKDSLPGEMFYTIKLATEKAQLTLAPNDQYATRLHIEFADRRIAEVARISEDAVTRADLANATLASFDTEVTAVAAGLEKLRLANPSDLAETAKLVDRKLDSYQSVLKSATGVLPAGSKLALAQAQNLVDGTAINALAVIVEKNLQGDAQAPKVVVAAKVGDRLKEAEDKLAAVAQTDDNAQSTTKAKAAIAEAKALIKTDNYSAALSKIMEVAELTKSADQTESAPSTGTAPSGSVTPASSTKPEPDTAKTTPAPTKAPAPADAPVGSGKQ